ncbi:uncharacterized protein LOC118504691 [Anopheles stephensi]|uniref:uncharacterized protein LOC118504691 n=1 Tax=Anopheles stephensi TaxID=30069 RepID=UPI001658BFA9|nr:uncharacterized protein LOC118504691 [Anopheles stephensi]
MDLRNKNQSTAQEKKQTATKKSTAATRPNTAAVPQYDRRRPSGLPDGSKSLSKIHPLGTIPKYLRKEKQKSTFTSSTAVQETFDTQSDKANDTTEPVESISEAELDATYKQQTIDRLERQVRELLSELGYREHRIRELELSLSSLRQMLEQMQSMMQSHLKVQQPIVTRIPKANKTLLLLQMILDSQSNSRAGEQDHERRCS